ncbi:MAG: hypothetical protein U0746_14040 [Gemmataceae bacterium]
MHVASRLVAVVVTVLAIHSAFAQVSGEAEYRLSLRTAERLAQSDVAKATDELHRLVGLLEGDRQLPSSRREQLLRIANDRLRVLTSPIPADIPGPTPKVLLTAEATRKAEEWAKVKASLDTATSLIKQGKSAEAAKHMQQLAALYQQSVAVSTLAGIVETNDRRATDAATRTIKEKGTLDVLAGIDRSAASPKGDVEFAKDFKERTAKRQADTKPTAEEMKILKALDTPVTAPFSNSKLQDAVDYLSTLMGMPVVFDPAAMDELKIGYDTPVNFATKRPVSARSVLKAVLGQAGLTYVVRDGQVFATTPERAKAFLVTKTYYLGDLVKPIGFLSGGFEGFNALQLIDSIVNSVDPDSWDIRGGPGTIRYYAPTMSLVVRASVEVHARMKAR